MQGFCKEIDKLKELCKL